MILRAPGEANFPPERHPQIVFLAIYVHDRARQSTRVPVPRPELPAPSEAKRLTNVSARYVVAPFENRALRRNVMGISGFVRSSSLHPRYLSHFACTGSAPRLYRRLVQKSKRAQTSAPFPSWQHIIDVVQPNVR